MPFTPLNFLQAESKPYNDYGDLIQNAIEGYKASRVPKQLAQEEQQRELANVLLGHQGVNEGIKSRHLDTEYETNAGYKQALTDQVRQLIENPGLASSIPEAAFPAFIDFYSKATGGSEGSPGNDNEKVRMLREGLERHITKKKQELQRAKQIIDSNDWNGFTVDQKANIAAITNELGIPQDVLNEGVMNGKTPREVWEEAGKTPEEIQEAMEHPKYLATRATQSQSQTRGTYGAEREVVSSFMNKAFERFPSTLFNVSPQMVALQLSGEDTDAQSDYWAARALGIENAGITAKMLGVPSGITMMKSIQSKALTETNAIQALISPEVYRKTQEKINRVTNEALKAGQDYALGIGGKKEDQQLADAISGKSQKELEDERTLALAKKIQKMANQPGGSTGTFKGKIKQKNKKTGKEEEIIGRWPISTFAEFQKEGGVPISD